MKVVGVLTAMSVEYNQLANMLTESEMVNYGEDSYRIGKIGSIQIILIQCGIGKVNAAMCSTLLIDRFHPDLVISTGVAGGIDSCLDVMDVVVSNQTVYHDMWCGPGEVWGAVQGLAERFDSDKEVIEVALSLKTDVQIRKGLICTGDIFVTKSEDKDRIKSLFPEALAVDMESCAIAQVCYLRKVPFVSFRIISDTPGAKDHFTQYADFWQTMADKSFGVTKAFLMSI